MHHPWASQSHKRQSSTLYTDTYITNQRSLLHYLIEKARLEFNDAYANEVEGPELQAYEEITAQQIEKLWFLDTYDTILLDNGQHIVLQGEQVLKNRELITQELQEAFKNPPRL